MTANSNILNMYKLILVTAGLLLRLSSAHANCELSWVAEVEKNQNWMHTVAVYPSEPKRLFKLPQLVDSRLQVTCEPERLRFCEGMKSMAIGSKACATGKSQKHSKSLIARSSEDAVGEEPNGLSYWSVKSCLSSPIPAGVVAIGNTGLIAYPKVYPLTARPAERQSKLEAILRALPALKNTKLSEYPELEIDVTKMPSVSLLTYANAGLKDFEVAELKVKLRIGDVAAICEKGCAKPKAEITYPLIFLKRGGEWVPFANGITGQCSAYNSVKEATLEQKMLQTFGTPVGYAFLDFDHDGKIDAFQLSARPHMPGSVTIYDLSGSEIEVGGQFCISSRGKCEPEPGC